MSNQKKYPKTIDQVWSSLRTEKLVQTKKTVARLFTVKIFQYGGRHRAIGTMCLTMWPVTWPTEANENTRVARGTLSAITVGSSNLCGGPKFRAAAPNIVADQNFSVVLNLFIRYPSTYYGKVSINPLMANIRNPDFSASPLASAAWFVVVRPCYLNRDLLSGPKGN